MIVSVILGCLVSLSLCLGLWQWLAARMFPLHHRIAESTDAPPVTLLKPLRGAEPATKDCLRSWFDQQYSAPVQLLFGVASPEDPAASIVRDLIREFPHRDAELVPCDQTLGTNAKVSTLVQLQSRAKNDLMVISDADVRVPADLLANIAAPFADSKTGLVTCFYRLANPASLAMHWEAVAINSDFWSQVLQSQSLKPIDFALGAVMATRKRIIDEIGGLGVLLSCLADDYQLGHRIAKLEKEIHLCPVVVECWSPPQNWRQVWKHQLRWSRTIRVCAPLPYFLSILSNATIWPLLAMILAPTLWMISLAAACVLARLLIAYDNQQRLLGFSPNFRSLLMIWPKDLLNAVIWLFAFLSNRIEWRGEIFRVQRGGQLVRLGAATDGETSKS